MIVAVTFVVYGCTKCDFCIIIDGIPTDKKKKERHKKI